MDAREEVGVFVGPRVEGAIEGVEVRQEVVAPASRPLDPAAVARRVGEPLGDALGGVADPFELARFLYPY